jgi:BlaI family penicillinase repressor
MVERRMRGPRKLGDLELQILNVLWAQGPSTVREVLEALPNRPRPRYTTVLTMMRVMHEKGYLTRETRARAHTYRARLQERRVKRGLLQRLIDSAFRGSVEAVLVGLLEDQRLTPEQLARVRELIAERERTKGE